jgi:flavodoxin
MNGTDTNRNNTIQMEWIQTIQTGTTQYEQKGRMTMTIGTKGKDDDRTRRKDTNNTSNTNMNNMIQAIKTIKTGTIRCEQKG